MELEIRIKGTEAELSDVIRALHRSGTAQPIAVEQGDGEIESSTGTGSGNEESKFVTTRFARRALKRRTLSKPEEGAAGALQGAGGLDPTGEAAGGGGLPALPVCGSDGGVRPTPRKYPGFDSEADFFDYEWDEEAETWSYRLPETVRRPWLLSRSSNSVHPSARSKRGRVPNGSKDIGSIPGPRQIHRCTGEIPSGSR